MSSVVTFNRLENQYSYSFESSTQSNDLRLLIDQSDNGLKISIINEKGSEFPVEGDSIRGLPKTSKVPSWMGGRMSFSSEMSDLLREEL